MCSHLVFLWILLKVIWKLCWSSILNTQCSEVSQIFFVLFFMGMPSMRLTLLRFTYTSWICLLSLHHCCMTSLHDSVYLALTWLSEVETGAEVLWRSCANVPETTVSRQGQRQYWVLTGLVRTLMSQVCEGVSLTVWVWEKEGLNPRVRWVRWQL